LEFCEGDASAVAAGGGAGGGARLVCKSKSPNWLNRPGYLQQVKALRERHIKKSLNAGALTCGRQCLQQRKDASRI